MFAQVVGLFEEGVFELPPIATWDVRRGVDAFRFVREGRAAGALDHQNVCAIHEVGESEDGYLFLAMTLYPGETLSDRGRPGACTVLR